MIASKQLCEFANSIKGIKQMGASALSGLKQKNPAPTEGAGHSQGERRLLVIRGRQSSKQQQQPAIAGKVVFCPEIRLTVVF
jgi:hypothetical protein